jgi:hypothetical protein
MHLCERKDSALAESGEQPEKVLKKSEKYVAQLGNGNGGEAKRMSQREQHKGISSSLERAYGLVGTQGSGHSMLPSLPSIAASGAGGGPASKYGNPESKYGNPAYNSTPSVYRNKGLGTLRMGGGLGGPGNINSSIHGGGQDGGGNIDYDQFGRKNYA